MVFMMTSQLQTITNLLQFLNTSYSTIKRVPREPGLRSQGRTLASNVRPASRKEPRDRSIAKGAYLDFTLPIRAKAAARPARPDRMSTSQEHTPAFTALPGKRRARRGRLFATFAPPTASRPQPPSSAPSARPPRRRKKAASTATDARRTASTSEPTAPTRAGGGFLAAVTRSASPARAEPPAREGSSCRRRRRDSGPIDRPRPRTRGTSTGARGKPAPASRTPASAGRWRIGHPTPWNAASRTRCSVVRGPPDR